MRFEPVAVVGRGCVLPGALDPDAFWDNVVAGRSSLTPAPEGRWRLPREYAVGTAPERAWTDQGGYVRDFDAAFDPGGFALDAELIAGLDPVFRWVLYAVRAALRESGQDALVPRTGLVLGNLCYPTAALARYAEHVWLGAQPAPVRDALLPPGTHRPDPRNRFSAGLPAQIAARALGLGGGAFCLDAACASSLYAVTLACARLHDGTADLMVAGGVSAADLPLIHIGFRTLDALSRTGRSRPFHRAADGLVPAEGAAVVALMRLSDAVRAGAPVLGVLRGAGLSNDGRTGGPLAPSQAGQARAMRLAYERAGVSPGTVSLVECHATGTATGDAVEIGSMASVFAGCHGVPIGSVKSNIGHAMTAAGAAGLLKVLAALRAGVRPPTLGAGEPLDALAGSPFRLLHEAEPWPGPRRAAVSGFGFGGCNAHLVIDADHAVAIDPVPRPAKEQVAIVGLGARVGDGRGAGDLTASVLSGRPPARARTVVEVDPDGLRVPPRDLESALAQQVLVLEAAREAVRGVRLPRDRTAVLVGMGCDPEAARELARFRLPWWLRHAQDAVAPPMAAARVVGTLPNVVANRINAQLDVTGPGYAVAAEEASGVVALRLAARAVGTGEADAAVVGAVDLSCEPVHEAALRELGHDREPADAAVAVVLKRLADARRDGDPVLAVLDDAPAGAADLTVDAEALFGSPHAASGLLSVVTAAITLRHRAVPAFGAARTAEVVVTPLAGAAERVRLRAGDLAPWTGGYAPSLHVFSGRDRAEVLAALAAGRESAAGPARLALVRDRSEPLRIDAARQWLTDGGTRPEGMAYRDAPLGGEVGFVFTGGAAAYPGMGREVALAFPAFAAAPGWVVGDPRDAVDQFGGAGALAALHARITRELLGLSPQAALGYSSGESAALFALGAWADPAGFLAAARASGLFAPSSGRWAGYAVAAPAERVQAALADEPGAHLLAVNAPDTCAVGGDPAACAAALARLGATAVPIDYDVVAHVPELAGLRDRYLALHHRPTAEVPGVRFYTAATGGWYRPTADTAAEAVTGQALRTIDFVALVERAWADGVRVFVEHGPRDLCTGWIGRILAGRDHLAVALDRPGRPLAQLGQAVAELAAAGVPVRAGALFDHLATAPADPDPPDALRLPAHPPPIRLPALRRPAPETLVAEHHQRVAALHRDFLATQAATHQRFLQVRQRQAEALHAAVRTTPLVLDRAALERLATEPAAGRRRLRPPAPPLLLIDRVVRAGTDTIHTETDVRPGAWYLDPAGRMPAGVLLETGQSVVVLLRLLDADLAGPADLFYRLLDVEYTIHGGLPEAGETLRGELRLDRRDSRLVSYRYTVHSGDRPRLTLRARGGLFTAADLGGSFPPVSPTAPPDGDLLSGEVTRVDSGYLRTERPIDPGDWYFAAHFRDDPCVPGNLLVEGCLRAMERYLAGAEGAPHGRCEPVPDRPARVRLSRQITPHDRRLTYEVEVRELTAGPRPTLVADVRCAIDGTPALHAEGLAIRLVPTGPTFDRNQLERLATGRISELFGPRFAAQDARPRQTRLPAPPLLLVDRVTRLDAVPASMATGTIHTETDIPPDAWYLDPAGRMPAGLMVEAGQADLLLISWLGVDLTVPADRVYRLLGVDLEFHAGLPEPGETLRFGIGIDGHAEHDGVRLFSFHYDCHVGDELRLTARNGQAGYFTDAEIAGSGGVLWNPEDDPPLTDTPLDPPAAEPQVRSFDAAAVRAVAEGRPADCFGPRWRTTRAHVRTPRPGTGRLRLLAEVPEYDPAGGPWRRGYLRAESPVTPGDWFFAGHFAGDPCMPGTLMVEGCLQAMAFYLTAAGHTIDRDGWRFEPVPHRTYRLRCRGQVGPASRRLTYEVFVRELSAGPCPTLVADVVCTVDGVRALHARQLALRLVPDWPLSHWRRLGPPAVQRTGDPVPLATLGGLRDHQDPGVRYGYPELLACAWGRPSEASGAAELDGPHRVARLPGPPYLVLSRVVEIDGDRVVTEYDVPAEVWYAEQNGHPVAPLAVLVEIALQPCGWFAAHRGGPAAVLGRYFRNLGGDFTLLGDVRPGDGPVRTEVTARAEVRSGETTIHSFELECRVGDRPVLRGTATFGFFPGSAFADQPGLPPSAEERARLAEPGDVAVDLTTRPARYCGGPLRLPGPMLLMIDRITGYWPAGGVAGIGRIRGESDVDPGAWFFTAHFFPGPGPARLAGAGGGRATAPVPPDRAGRRRRPGPAGVRARPPDQLGVPRPGGAGRRAGHRRGRHRRVRYRRARPVRGGPRLAVGGRPADLPHRRHRDARRRGRPRRRHPGRG